MILRRLHAAPHAATRPPRTSPVTSPGWWNPGPRCPLIFGLPSWRWPESHPLHPLHPHPPRPTMPTFSRGNDAPQRRSDDARRGEPLAPSPSGAMTTTSEVCHHDPPARRRPQVALRPERDFRHVRRGRHVLVVGRHNAPCYAGSTITTAWQHPSPPARRPRRTPPTRWVRSVAE